MYKYALGHELKTLFHLTTREFDNLSKENGLDNTTCMHTMIVKFLLENSDKKLYQRDIESQFEITRSTVTHILKLMEKKGYIERTGSKTDARLKRLSLTPNGESLAKQANSVIYSFESILREGIAEDEIDSFIITLNRIRDNLLSQEDIRQKRLQQERIK